MGLHTVPKFPQRQIGMLQRMETQGYQRLMQSTSDLITPVLPREIQQPE